jgi:hypothetical protein
MLKQGQQTIPFLTTATTPDLIQHSVLNTYTNLLNTQLDVYTHLSPMINIVLVIKAWKTKGT